METIYPDQLTNVEGDAIAVQYAPYENYAEFWFGFIDYQNGRACPYGEDSVAGQAWDRGAEAAMRVLNGRRPRCEGCSI